MTKTVLYIATSPDSLKARPDENLDWLTSIPNRTYIRIANNTDEYKQTEQ